MEGFTNVGTTKTLGTGKMRVVRTPGGKRLLLNVAGQYYAIAAECTHQGCDLVDGILEGAKLTCVCHFAEFNVVTGAVEGGPAPEPIGVYLVRVEGDSVWVAG
jgi:3-phenylpropionate/trans-cinnamate dioxygenase ferredoxin component